MKYPDVVTERKGKRHGSGKERERIRHVRSSYLQSNIGGQGVEGVRVIKTISLFNFENME